MGMGEGVNLLIGKLRFLGEAFFLYSLMSLKSVALQLVRREDSKCRSNVHAKPVFVSIPGVIFEFSQRL